MFLLEFEKNLVHYFYNSPLRVKQVYFGDGKYTFLESFTKVKTMPYVHISRAVDSSSLGKSSIVYDGAERRTFFPIKIDYTMYCVVEKSVEMLSFMSSMRFYMKHHPNLYVWYPSLEPKKIELGSQVYQGTGYSVKDMKDPEFRDLHCAVVKKEQYYMVGAKKVPYFELSDGKLISYGGQVSLGDKTILDARDFVRVPDPVRVELAYSSINLEEIKNSVDEKGATRCIQIKFHVELFTEEVETLPIFKSVKVIVRAMPDGEQFVALEKSEESDEV